MISSGNLKDNYQLETFYLLVDLRYTMGQILLQILPAHKNLI